MILRIPQTRTERAVRLLISLVGGAALLILLSALVVSGGSGRMPDTAVAAALDDIEADVKTGSLPAARAVAPLAVRAPTFTLTAPLTVSTPVIPITWSVHLGATGLATLTLQYSGTHDSEWRLWDVLTVTDVISEGVRSLRVPVMNSTYAISGTVADAGGLLASDSVTTFVEPARIAIPLAVRSWPAWYAFDIYEPNDHPLQAWGPLTHTEAIQSYIWCADDKDDYFRFTPPAAGQVQVDLTGIVPAVSDYDLYVYYHDGTAYRTVGSSRLTNSVAEQVIFAGEAGWTYFVRIYPYRGFSSVHPYTLKVTFPTR